MDNCALQCIANGRIVQGHAILQDILKEYEYSIGFRNIGVVSYLYRRAQLNGLPAKIHQGAC